MYFTAGFTNKTVPCTINELYVLRLNRGNAWGCMRSLHNEKIQDAVRDIHKNAETFGETTVVQIINKKVEEGKVVAMAISDGHYVSPDVLIL